MRSPDLITEDSGALIPTFVKVSPTVRNWDPRNRTVPRRIRPILPREKRRNPASRATATVRLEDEDGFSFLYVSVLPLSSAAHKASHAHRIGEAH